METKGNAKYSSCVGSAQNRINLTMPSRKTLVLLVCYLVGHVSSNEAREYCQWEVFNATCSDDHVILIHTANYGRMRLGRCLSTDVYIGCSANVIPQLDSRCSGRQSCEITVPDSSLHQLQPCPRDMMAYLEAGYTCVKVQSSEQQQCLPGSSPIRVTDKAGLLASHVTQTSGQGSSDCPWRIDVEPGQRINIHLLDFTLTARQNADPGYNLDAAIHGHAEFCHMYAKIKEANSREFTVCAGKEREKLVYTSHTNSVEIHMMHDRSGGESIAFMLKYEAVGCPDLTPPSGAFVVRDGDKATVSCNHTSQAWHLVCKDTTWIGDAQQCSPEAIVNPGKDDESVLPSYGLFIAVGIGVVIGVCCGFTMLGTVLWCRRQKDRRKRRRQQEAHLMPATQTADTMTLHKCKVHRLKDGCGYTHVWEVQGRNQSTSGLSPDSAYQTYQGHLSLASAEPTVLYHTGKRDHMYESPTVDENGQKIPYYHEYDAQSQNQTNTRRTLCQNDHAHAHIHNHGPCHVHVPVEPPPDLISDDTDEEDRCRFVKPSGYTLVPDSPEKTTRSRSENHYT